MSIQRACVECGALSDSFRCEAHARHRANDATRGSRHKRGYGNAWAKSRAVWLPHNPFCVDPYRRHAGEIRATVVRDHIVRRTEGGSDTNDNYQALCDSCHNYKRYLESRGLAGTAATERNFQNA